MDLTFRQLEKLLYSGKKKKESRKKRTRSRSPRGGPPAQPTAPEGGFTNRDSVDYTVVVTNLHLEVSERDLFERFSKCAGRIQDLRLLKKQGVSTGVAHIEFADEAAVRKACASNETLKGQQYKVRRMRDMAISQQVKGKEGKGGKGDGKGGGKDRSLAAEMAKAREAELLQSARKLRVTKLVPVVNEEDLVRIFRPFGEIEHVKMEKDAQGKNGENRAFVCYKNGADARDAMMAMAGFSLAGQEIAVQMVDDKYAFMGPGPPPAPALPGVGSAPPGAPPPPPGAPPARKPEEELAAIQDQAPIKGDADFADEKKGILGVGGRQELMKKLMQSHDNTMQMKEAKALAQAASAGLSSGRTLLLLNMFQPNKVDLVKEPNFYQELHDDVKEECEKHGKTILVHVDKSNPTSEQGKLYVLLGDPGAKMRAKLALDGRWFGGRKVLAQDCSDTVWKDLS